MTDDPYVFPGTKTLRNKLEITNARQLNKVERILTSERAAEGLPSGDFDLTRLRAIHRHLFSDVYDWAGEIRSVELSKGGQQFMFRQFIETGMADVHRRIIAAGYFRGATVAEFSIAAGRIVGDINYVHPFREGNGRTQLLYLKQFSANAGHALDLRHLRPDAWIAASKRANDTDYAPMQAEIRDALEKSGPQLASKPRSRT